MWLWRLSWGTSNEILDISGLPPTPTTAILLKINSWKASFLCICLFCLGTRIFCPEIYICLPNLGSKIICQAFEMFREAHLLSGDRVLCSHACMFWAVEKSTHYPKSIQDSELFQVYWSLFCSPKSTYILSQIAVPAECSLSSLFTLDFPPLYFA